MVGMVVGTDEKVHSFDDVFRSKERRNEPSFHGREKKIDPDDRFAETDCETELAEMDESRAPAREFKRAETRQGSPRRRQVITFPPSPSRFCPVTAFDARDRRKSIGPIMSGG